MSEIFVSYASADRPRVAPLMQALEAEGLQLWWDRDVDYGQTFHKVIEQALTAAPCVIVVWTRDSIKSQWVLNEASDARKRDRLVPVLLDTVEPPLEFRHLQAADLSRWDGDSADPQFAGLRKGLVAMLGSSEAPTAILSVAPPPRQWWQTPAALALGVGGLLIGLSVLLFTLRQVGVIGAARQGADSTGPAPTESSPAAPEASTLPPDSRTPERQPAAGLSTEVENLLDPTAGARIIAANQEAWKALFGSNPQSTSINSNGFAILALPGNRAVTFDTLGVFVESTSGYNAKELAVYTSAAAAEGPFVKAAQLTLPNYRNMQQPFHELQFAPVTARFVKLEVLSFQDHDRPNGYLGSIRLYARGGGAASRR